MTSSRTTPGIACAVFSILLLGACTDAVGVSPSIPSSFGGNEPASPDSVTVTYLANEGFLLRAGEQAVLVDALFGNGLAGYPVVPTRLRSQLEHGSGPFSGIDCVLATHEHGDHFDANAVAGFLERTEARFVSNESAVSRVARLLGESARPRLRWLRPNRGVIEEVDCGGVKVSAMSFHHGSLMVKNLAFLIEIGGVTVLHVGDTEITAEQVRPWQLHERAIEVALLPAWHLTEPRWRPLVDEIAAGQIVAMHLPSPDAPPSWFGSAGSHRARIEQIRSSFPGTWIPLQAGDEKFFAAVRPAARLLSAMKGDPKTKAFATRAIHAGQPPDPTTGAVAVPIYQTSTYVQEELGRHKGYEYARVQNPTRQALEENIAALEGGVAGHCFASGMSAISTLLTLLEAGDHAVCSRNVYGGTFRFFHHILERYDLGFSWVDSTDLANVEAAMTPKTRLVYIETPTNPMMEVTDIAGAGAIARSHGAILAVDNTFMSPYFQRPLELGADVVIHSTTKFLNGHSDSIGGALVSREVEHAEWFSFVQKSAGAILSPFDSFLVLRGIKTLEVRMQRHESSGRRLAAFLDEHPKVLSVLYPGLPGHPGHRIQQQQASGFGALISFDLGSQEAAKVLLDTVGVMSLAESLGGVETLISHPASMTHASVPAERRTELGISEGLVRVSVGLEDPVDLIDDLDQALGRI